MYNIAGRYVKSHCQQRPRRRLVGADLEGREPTRDSDTRLSFGVDMWVRVSMFLSGGLAMGHSCVTGYLTPVVC